MSTCFSQNVDQPSPWPHGFLLFFFFFPLFYFFFFNEQKRKSRQPRAVPVLVTSAVAAGNQLQGNTLIAEHWSWPAAPL